MPRKFFSFRGGLSDFCALVPVVWCLSYSFTLGFVGAQIGRQSSTFALGVGLPIMAAPLLAAVGLVVGRLAAYLLAPVFPDRWVRVMKWGGPLVLMVIAIVASLQASGPLHAAEREARPRVVQNSVQLHRLTISQPAAGITPGARVYDNLQKVNKTIPWGDRSVQFADRGNTLEVRFAPTGNSLLIPLPGIDYINHIDAIPMRLGTSGRPALALLITGRATGQRDLLAVIAESGELVYLELLDRSWNFNAVSLAIAPSAAGDLILIGSEPQQLLVFGPQDSA